MSLDAEIQSELKDVALEMLRKEIAALRAENSRLRKELEHISQNLCGVKVEGEVTHDMVYQFVEGQIDKQADRADNMQADRNHYRDEEEKTAIENAVLRDENERLSKSANHYVADELLSLTTQHKTYREIAGELAEILEDFDLQNSSTHGLKNSWHDRKRAALARWTEIEKGKG